MILTFFLRLILTRFVTLDVEIKPFVLLMVFFVGIIGGGIGALYPALRAVRLDAIEALNYE